MASVEPDRWEPDQHLVDSVLAAGSSRKMSDFTPHDRAWLVAGLMLRGLTAEDIADRLKPCSVRLVRSIRAEPICQLAWLHQVQQRAFSGEVALARSERAVALRDLVAMTADRDRIKGQFERVLDARIVGDEIRFCRREHLMDRWNTYEYRGKRYCRTCRRENQQALRDSVKT